MDELTELAMRARRGDSATIAAFIRATQREVWSLCAYLVDENTADDLTQETYLRVFRALPSFRRESSARTWLLSIARRTCMDELRGRIRRRRRETLVAQVSDSAHQHPNRAGAEDQIEIRELLARLPDERRTAFVLTQILGLSYADAGRICHCPEGTIGSRVVRARDQLIHTLTPGRQQHTRQEARPDAMD